MALRPLRAADEKQHTDDEERQRDDQDPVNAPNLRRVDAAERKERCRGNPRVPPADRNDGQDGQ